MMLVRISLVRGLSLRFLTFSSAAPQTARRGVWRWRALRRADSRVALVVALLAAGMALAQEHKPKVPVIDKITSASLHQAFSGTVQSLDEKHNILNVNAVEGGVTETFPIKKNTHVITAAGTRIRLSDLAPGANVIVYFELRADHRNVTKIEILTNESKKQAPPS
jgi:hypothetical protein